MAPCLGSLPPELVNQIITHICGNGNLLNLALCCHSLHKLVIPHLYAHITLRVHKVQGGHCHPGLRALTSRLLKDPVLASYIRSIKLPNSWDCAVAYNSDGLEILTDAALGYQDTRLVDYVKVGSCKQEPRQSWTASENGMVAKIKMAAGTKKSENPIETAEHEDESMHIARLLLATPNLEVLDIVEPCYKAYHAMKVIELAVHSHKDPGPTERPLVHADPSSDVFERAVFGSEGVLRQLPLQNLRKIACTFNYDQHSPCHVSLILFLCLPSIREIFLREVTSSLSLDDERNWLWLTEGFSGTVSTVERLELHHCSMNDEDLETALRPCRSLRTFVYDFNSNPMNDPLGEHDELSLPGLGKALSAAEATLENLWIDYPDGAERGSQIKDLANRMPSLSRFERLKNLNIGMFLYFGANIMADDDWTSHDEFDVDESSLPDLVHLLPISLETLYISETTPRLGILIRALEILLQHTPRGLPKLRKITFEAFLAGNNGAPSLNKLKDLATAAEVEIHIIDDELTIAAEEWEFHTPDVLDSEQGWTGHNNFDRFYREYSVGGW
ncbi:MAG: hypothetical protein Q9188_004373 [Gyalolechia gomerana]